MSKSLILRIMSEKMAPYTKVRSVIIPDSGWVASIRQSLNMTMEQLGRKLNITRQGVGQLEHREQEGSISLKTMRDVANALDMQLVYAIVPKTETLEAYVEQKARQFARETLLSTNQQMRLEGQAVDDERLKRAIDDMVAEAVRTVDRQLWD
jgi:predicted DNA-binding mobile mystery protein A